MIVRDPIVAGRFYPDTPEDCAEQVAACQPEQVDVDALPAALLGGIVPHAGWAFSGPTAGHVFAALAARGTPDTVVLFGADHHRSTRSAGMFGSGRWVSPMGPADIDEGLAAHIAANTQTIREDPYAHNQEHSLEVQIPFIQNAWPDAKILPIVVAPARQAVDVGLDVARAVEATKANVVIVGSTDLTHYGENYGFAPEGVGAEALAWAKDVNDQRLIDAIASMDPEVAFADAAANRSACGAGAIVATIAACKHLGATEAKVLEHTTSYEVATRFMEEAATMSVGYAGIVFGKS